MVISKIWSKFSALLRASFLVKLQAYFQKSDGFDRKAKIAKTQREKCPGKNNFSRHLISLNTIYRPNTKKWRTLTSGDAKLLLDKLKMVKIFF